MGTILLATTAADWVASKIAQLAHTKAARCDRLFTLQPATYFPSAKASSEDVAQPNEGQIYAYPAVKNYSTTAELPPVSTRSWSELDDHDRRLWATSLVLFVAKHAS